MNHTIKVNELIRSSRRELGLILVAGEKGADKEITTYELQRPGLAIAGYTEHFAERRIQIIGQYEMHFIESLPKDVCIERFKKLLKFPIPCLIFSKNLTPPEGILSLADEYGVPILTTKRGTYELQTDLGDFLQDYFAPQAVFHGSVVDVYGVGLLFRGKSGIGKSECALDLVARGHRLVADDYVVVKKKGDMLLASSKDNMGHFMEIRGIGIIDVEKLYGIHAIRVQKRIELIVQLVPWNQMEDYERLGMDMKYTDMLGIRVPEVILPISPGKNISTLSEVIAMNFMLKVYGENPAKTFLDRIQEGMERKKKTMQYRDKE